jgi:hypothetical protein
MNPRNIIYIWIDAKIQKEILTSVGHSQLEQKKTNDACLHLALE